MTNGVKQGRVLAPTLFNRMFADMLTDDFHNFYDGIPIKWRKLYNLRRILQSKPRYSENCRISFVMLMTWQKCLNREGNAKMYGFSSQACDNYDITISTKKTDFVHRPAPRKPYNEPTITVKKKKKEKKQTAVCWQNNIFGKHSV